MGFFSNYFFSFYFDFFSRRLRSGSRPFQASGLQFFIFLFFHAFFYLAPVFFGAILHLFFLFPSSQVNGQFLLRDFRCFDKKLPLQKLSHFLLLGIFLKLPLIPSLIHYHVSKKQFLPTFFQYSLFYTSSQ